MGRPRLVISDGTRVGGAARFCLKKGKKKGEREARKHTHEAGGSAYHHATGGFLAEKKKKGGREGGKG